MKEGEAAIGKEAPGSPVSQKGGVGHFCASAVLFLFVFVCE